MPVRHNFRFVLAATVATALLAGVAQPALAYFDNYLSGSIVGTLTRKEAASLKQAVHKALSDTEDNQTVTWHYPAEGRRQAVDGTISPVATKTDKGQSCRRLKSELKRGSATEAWSGWFCKQADGAWKARNVAD